MQWRNILLAAGVIGAASAQSSQSGAATTSMASMASGTSAMASMGGASTSGKKHSMMPVPSDLSQGFKTDQITLKVHWKDGKKKGKKGKKGKKSSSVSGNAASTDAPSGTSSTPDASGTPSGKKDGKKGKKGKKHHHKLNMADTMNAPKFALGKANGANAQSKWVIVMIDTTDNNNRMLHYVHSDYMIQPGKNGNMSMMGQQQQQSMPTSMMTMSAGGQMGGKKGKGMHMKLNSTTQPQMAWKGPGTMGDTGTQRMYTILMYSQQGDFAAKGMPQMGQPINMQDFVQQNNLQPAVAGKSFMVNTASNATGSASGSAGAPGETAAVQAATGAASTLRGSIYSAGIVGSVAALAMALL